jgi:hypothetical protein
MNVRMLMHRIVSLRGTDNRNRGQRGNFNSAPFLGLSERLGQELNISHALHAQPQGKTSLQLETHGHPLRAGSRVLLEAARKVGRDQ